MENASYGLIVCAEVEALQGAIAAGYYNVIELVVIGGADEVAGGRLVVPCGRCRQCIYEAAQVSGLDVRMLCCNADLSEIVVTSISELLPTAFGPVDLGIARLVVRSTMESRERTRTA